MHAIAATAPPTIYDVFTVDCAMFVILVEFLIINITLKNDKMIIIIV